MAVLISLHDFTDSLAGEKKVTVSAIIPLLRHIKDTVLANKQGESSLTKEIKARIKSDLERCAVKRPSLPPSVCSWIITLR